MTHQPLRGPARRTLPVALAVVLILAAVFVGPALAGPSVKMLTEVRAAAYEAVANIFWTGTSTYAANSKIAAGDVNGDGFGDVIQFYKRNSAGSSVFFFKSNGTTMTRSTAWNGTMAFAKTQVAAGDYDGDGKTDLFLLYDQGGGIGSVYVMMSNGSTLSAPKEIYRSGKKSLYFALARLTAGDPNKDGMDEAVILNENGAGKASILVIGKAYAQVKGIVQNASNGAALPGATVTLYNSSSIQVASATSGPTGAYTLSVPAGTNFHATFSATGFLGADYYGISPGTASATTLETVRLVPTNGGNGNASGLIKNAFDSQPVSGLAVSLRAGLNNTTGSTLAYTATTGADGTYSFTGLPSGVYTAQISGTGFTTTFFTIVVVGGQNNPDQNMSITPVLTGSDIRIVLTWGANPADLDSHLTGPISGTTRFHVYYPSSSRRYPVSTSSPAIAILDTDDRDGYGPETITLSQTIGGVYRYSVHDYSNRSSSSSTALGSSGAQVRVYKGASLVATYNVPNSGGTLWTVCTFSGTTVTPVNTMTYQSDSGAVQ